MGNTAAKLVFVKASGSRVERKKPNLFAPAQRVCGARRFFILLQMLLPVGGGCRRNEGG
jgi:hypothetical protein